MFVLLFFVLYLACAHAPDKGWRTAISSIARILVALIFVSMVIAVCFRTSISVVGFVASIIVVVKNIIMPTPLVIIVVIIMVINI